MDDNDDDAFLFELDLETEAADAAAFDTWLSDHVADVLQLDGFRSAEILADAAAPGSSARRTVQYRVRDRAALDAYLASELARRPGQRARLATRTLAHREDFQHGAITGNCLNCGEVLRGQHCAYCGQRARIRVLSLWGLLREVLGDTLNWDSRLWRTLRPLAFSPGLLTREFLLGRRTHYTPPFRMYLILSVAFFLLAASGEELRLNVGDGSAFLTFDQPAEKPAAGTTAAPAPSAAQPQPQAPAPGAAPAAADPVTNEADRRKLVDSLIAKLPESEQAHARAEAAVRIKDLDAEDVAFLQQLSNDPCGPQNVRIDIGAFQDQLPRVQQACRKIVADAQGFGRAVYQNVPRTMFVFLPLIALLMQFLYLGSGRFYVEHLLFFVHYHAFFFLGGLVILLLDRATTTLQSEPLHAAAAATTLGFFGYAPLYLYFAMRRVYAQGRLLTLAKFLLLISGYFIGLVLSFVALLLYTALTL